MPKAKKTITPTPVMKAQGQTKKRTPQSAFDPAAGKDIYEPEKIVAERIVKGGATQYSVKMHGDLSKSVSADTIEHSLFAAINAP